MNAFSIRPIAETADSVTLSRADFEAMQALIEDAADLADIEAVGRRIDAGETDVLPAAVVDRMLAGDHPVLALREHRGLTATDLARAVGTSQSYITEIETGAKRGGIDTLRRVADALGVPLDLIVAAPDPATDD